MPRLGQLGRRHDVSVFSVYMYTSSCTFWHIPHLFSEVPSSCCYIIYSSILPKFALVPSKCFAAFRFPLIPAWLLSLNSISTCLLALSTSFCPILVCSRVGRSFIFNYLNNAIPQDTTYGSLRSYSTYCCTLQSKHVVTKTMRMRYLNHVFFKSCK